MDYLTHTSRDEGVIQLLERLGDAADRDDAERVWDALRAEGLITHDGQRFHMPDVDFRSWAA